MRVAFLLPSLANKGPCLVVRTLVEELVSHGHDVIVFYFDIGDEIFFPCPVRRISFWHKPDFDVFDIFHSHGIRPDSYVLRFKRRLGTVCLSTIHSYWGKDLLYTYGTLKGWAMMILWNLILIRHDQVIVLSEDMGKYYRKFLLNQRITPIYNSKIVLEGAEPDMSPEEIACFSTFKKKYTILGAIAQVSKLKGFSQVLKILPGNPDLGFLLVGDGNELESLKTEARALSVADQCLFVGNKPEAYRWLKLAEMYVMTSYTEGFPLVLLEAAFMRRPIVCSDLPVFRELFPEEVCYFELDNSESLIRAIRHCYENADHYSKAVYTRASDNFSVVLLRQRHEQLYRRLLD